MIGTFQQDIPSRDGYEELAPKVEHTHPAWPTKCEHCDYLFQPQDDWQEWAERLMRRSDTNDLTTRDAAPPGAMWDAWWYRDHQESTGTDGRSLVVRLPNGHEWCMDFRCSNCTLPQDNVHKCWVRHGDPPNLTVNKDGVTCQAGAGSIWSRQGHPDEWHGFLTKGKLVKC